MQVVSLGIWISGWDSRGFGLWLAELSSDVSRESCGHGEKKNGSVSALLGVKSWMDDISSRYPRLTYLLTIQFRLPTLLTKLPPST